jgi:hypothetical protein
MRSKRRGAPDDAIAAVVGPDAGAGVDGVVALAIGMTGALAGSATGLTTLGAGGGLVGPATSLLARPLKDLRATKSNRQTSQKRACSGRGVMQSGQLVLPTDATITLCVLPRKAVAALLLRGADGADAGAACSGDPHSEQ